MSKCLQNISKKDWKKLRTFSAVTLFGYHQTKDKRSIKVMSYNIHNEHGTNCIMNSS